MKAWVGIGLLLAAVALPVLATPPEYSTFERTQRTGPAPDASRLLRIWAINIGQGDALLIQLPTALNVSGQRIEILVDGGPPGQQLPVFLHELYGASGTVIEYAVLTHHDQDHVAGLTTLLRRSELAIEHIFHNGLVSWRPTLKGFQNLGTTDRDQAVFSVDDGAIDRGMAFLEPNDPKNLQSSYLISSRAELKSAFDQQELQGIYEKFGTAIVNKTTPKPVTQFDRADVTGGVLPQFAGAGGAPSVALKALWPTRPPQAYGDATTWWSYTINANSVTFKLTYGDFEMLFTGDHNDESEQELLSSLADASVLQADVLKTPHHGSSKALKKFVDAVHPVVSVTSMGKNTHGHPTSESVEWAGGAHRMYHTYWHERKFKNDMSAAAKTAMIEESHVLIETDGEWFRIVETRDPKTVPTVSQVTRGNGTRWIKAK